MKAKNIQSHWFSGERLLRVAWLSLLLVVQPSLWAATSTKPADEVTPAAELPEYRVGPGDVLSVQVFGLDQLNQRITVSNSGKIHVANLGVITVADMTAGEIEKDITTRLVAHKLINDPWVRVSVAEYHAQPIYVVGEVNTPGQFMVTGEMYLLDAISRAGGLTQGAGQDGYLLRRQYRPRVSAGVHYALDEAQGDRQGEITQWLQNVNEPVARGTVPQEPVPGQSLKVNLEDLKDGSDPSLNVLLQGGDVFFVPRRHRKYVYIVGEVLYPGAYGLPPKYDHLTVGRAVAYAGGPLKTARSGSGFIMRRGEDGEVTRVAFDFNAIIKGQQPDEPIQPDDVIYVPRSVAKVIGYGMLDLVAYLSQQFLIF